SFRYLHALTVASMRRATILLLCSASLVGMAPLPRVTEQPMTISHTASALRCGRCARGAARDYLRMMSKSGLSQSDRHGEREEHDGKSLQHSVFLPRSLCFQLPRLKICP